MSGKPIARPRPEPWVALVAGFPIVGEDVGALALAELADLARELDPYLGGGPRRAFHRQARPILRLVLSQVADCFRRTTLNLASTESVAPIVGFVSENDVTDSWEFRKIVSYQIETMTRM